MAITTNETPVARAKTRRLSIPISWTVEGSSDVARKARPSRDRCISAFSATMTATAETTAWIPGPYTSKPKITTGAGDHFNAGFSLGQVLGLSPEACLTTGVCTSGHYVRTGESPSFDDLQTFLANWQ